MSVRPHLTDDFLMYKVVKQDVLEFIILGGEKNRSFLCESLQEFVEVVIMYKNQMLHVNGMKDV